MAEYKYVDWPGLQYYHSKVTDLIDSRLRDCIRFGGEVLFEALESPDTPDLNIIYRILNSFTVSPSNERFDDSTWNKTYPAGTLLQVVQTLQKCPNCHRQYSPYLRKREFFSFVCQGLVPKPLSKRKVLV